jgi:hypothetical protein
MAINQGGAIMTQQKSLIPVPIPYYGGCPVCHRNNGIVQIHQGDWVVCHVHRRMWLVSASLWATGTALTKKQWAKVAARFRHYEEVEPVWDSKENRVQEPGILCGLPASVEDAIIRVLNYVWNRESMSYAKLTAAASTEHIFRFAAVVSGWLNGLAEQRHLEDSDRQSP